MSFEAQAVIFFSLIATVYLCAAALGAWINSGFGARLFSIYMAVLPLLSGLAWALTVGGRLPAYMKLEMGFLIGLTGLICFVLPQLMTTRSEKQPVVVFGILISSLITVAVTVFIALGTALGAL
jgi:hypothetical protein